jgi:hypothetical protein
MLEIKIKIDNWHHNAARICFVIESAFLTLTKKVES